MKLICGTMKIGGVFDGLVVHERPRRSSIGFLTHVVNSGISVFDTAPIYARGRAELLLGEIARVHKVEVLTKVGVDITGVLPRLDYSYHGYWRGFRTSLERLGGATVDTIFLHNPQRRHILSDDFLKFGLEALSQGYCRHIGYSCISEATIKYAAAAFPTGKIMLEASLLEKSAIAGLARSLGGRLVIRSLFNGGGSLKQFGAVASKRCQIALRLRSLTNEFPGAALVVAPNTVAQFQDLTAKPVLEATGC